MSTFVTETLTPIISSNDSSFIPGDKKSGVDGMLEPTSTELIQEMRIK